MGNLFVGLSFGRSVMFMNLFNWAPVRCSNFTSHVWVSDGNSRNFCSKLQHYTDVTCM
jgi:hypothetical protein